MDIPIRNLFRFGYQASHATFKSFGRHGAMGTLRRAIRQFRIVPPDASGQAFDCEFGTDTETIVPLWKLAIASDNRDAGIRYQSLSPDLVRQSIRSLPIDHSQFRFIDYGSGKGRILLIASEFPFQSVTGLEFAKELHEIAVKNIAKHPVARKKDVHSICIDAVEFNPPIGQLVLFFFNPFGSSVIRRVLKNLRALLNDKEFETWVIYHNPQHAKIFVKSGLFSRIQGSNPWAIFRNRLE